MSNINDLYKYRKAQVMMKDIPEMLRVCDYTLRGMSKFGNKYKLAREVCTLIEDVKSMLEIHLNNNKKIIDKKGLIEE